MNIERFGRLGVWTMLDGLDAAQAAKFAQTLETQGYSALWIPEALGREPFSLATHVALHTEKIALATGIANIYARDPVTMRATQLTLSELCGGRFVLGLGVSHSHLVTKVRGHEYKRPVSTMRSYLETMQKALYQGYTPDEEAPILLAALRPKMLQLSAEMTQGAHPYFVTPEHTQRAREILGKGSWLCPEQKVMLETDASVAREAARKHMKVYLGLPNYQNALKWIGFEDADFADRKASDRLVDAIVAWGTEDQIRERIQAHWDAGADHVCIQPLRSDGKPGPDTRALEALAPGA